MSRKPFLPIMGLVYRKPSLPRFGVAQALFAYQGLPRTASPLLPIAPQALFAN